MKKDKNVERKRMFHLANKLKSKKEKKAYQLVVAKIVYDAIPKKQREILEEYDRNMILEHIGTVISEILPYQDFTSIVEKRDGLTPNLLKGYINGGIKIYTELIGEADDEEELEKTPKKVEDVLGDQDYGDLSEEVNDTMKKEIKKDNEKIEEKEKEEEEMVKDLTDEEENDDLMSFEDEAGEIPEEDEDTTVGETGEDNRNTEDTKVENEETEEETQIKESPKVKMGRKLKNIGPLGKTYNAKEDYIDNIKNKVIKNYSNMDTKECKEEQMANQAKIDVIVYIAVANTLDKLDILPIRKFLKRIAS